MERLLAYEGDRPRAQVGRQTLEPLAGAGEVGAAQVAGAACRAQGRVGQPDSEAERLLRSFGRSSLGVKPASRRRRQKSLRGLAKCASAAAET
jgi:hypothetical protein